MCHDKQSCFCPCRAVLYFCLAIVVLLGASYGPHTNATENSIVVFVSNKDAPLPETPYGDVLRADHRVALVDAWSDVNKVLTGEICGLIVTREVIENDLIDWEQIRTWYEAGVGIGAIGLSLNELKALLGMQLSNRADFDQATAQGSYPPERWPASYIVFRGTKHGGSGGFGMDALYHPEFGWQSL